MIDKRVMATLKENIGKKVSVIDASRGVLGKTDGILEKVGVEDFTYIKVGAWSIPFVGLDCAIQSILDEKGRSIYNNPLILADYSTKWKKKTTEMNKMKIKTFGKKIGLATKG